MTDGVRVLAGLILVLAVAAFAWNTMRQCRKPSGWHGRGILQLMNLSHGPLIAWALEHIQVNRGDAVLDVGCGGGLTIQRLAIRADPGMVHGVDYSPASVSASQAFNHDAIQSGRVKIQKANVSHLPFPDATFDLVTAVETHYYWPDLPANLLEVRRVLKPGGVFAIVAEAYARPEDGSRSQLVMKAIGGTVLSPDRHRDLLLEAGYTGVDVVLEPGRGWICAQGRKPVN